MCVEIFASQVSPHGAVVFGVTLDLVESANLESLIRPDIKGLRAMGIKM